MARKLPGLQRVLDVPSLAAVAYGEIGSSLYFALGVIAFFALGFTPWVLLAAGVLFLVVALSYAEGTTAIPEPGGAATFVRRAFNDPAGFLTGWALILDYLIVMALAGLFVPHYVGHAVGWEGLTDEPWDTVLGVVVILGIGALRLVRRTSLYRTAIVIAGIAVVSHLLLVLLGLALLFSFGRLDEGLDLGTAPTWEHVAFALPLAMLAYTGLETVANLAAETREPGRTLPRSLFAGIGLVVAVSFAIGLVAVSAFPGGGGLAEGWIRAPLMGLAAALDEPLPALAGDALRVSIGLSGALVLLTAVTTSISGAGRLAYAMGQRNMLPRTFGTLNRRTLISPAAIVGGAVTASGLLVTAHLLPTPTVRLLAGLFSFGVLFAFTAAQLAVIRLRFTEPDLERPFRAPIAAAYVGAPLTFAVLLVALSTHDATRVAGPLWLAGGFLIYAATRMARGHPVFGRVEPAAPDLVPAVEGAYGRILVPMKLGPIGEEVIATAIKLAEEQSATVSALHVISIPLDRSMDADMVDAEERAEASIAEAKILAAEHGVTVEGRTVRARAIGEAIVEEARNEGVDLIILGSAPRWRRQSRFFSPTVDYILRHAPCEVMVMAYPQGVLEEEEEGRVTSAP